MENRIELDITRMLEDSVGRDQGSSLTEINEHWPRVKALLQGLEAKRKNGDLPFYDLPDDNETVTRIEEYAASVRTKFRNLVVLGIGGSALGAIALKDALKPLNWNLLDDSKRDGLRLFVADNSDPEYLHAIMESCPPEETMYNVVTKSGSTAETMAAYLAFRSQMKKSLKDRLPDHLVFTTDPSKGNLRAISRVEGIQTFSIPPGVGGRFSVLSSVGLLPAACIGIDIKRVLQGAAEQREKVFQRDYLANPSAAFALLQYLADVKRNQSIHVIMPYANALFRTADWFRQLWAESLGKKVNLRGETVHTGPTPVAALGATDQHSQVQLYTEGPKDKTFTFIIPETYRHSVTCGRHHPDLEGIDYLSGKELSELIHAEARATQRALTASKHPNMAFHIDLISEETVGGLMYLLEAATLVAGGLYEINPLDQPGVEAGKVDTYALLGRTGYEDTRLAIQEEDSRQPLICR